MVRSLIKFVLASVLVVSFVVPALAQSTYDGAGQTTRSGGGPRKQLATIIFAGLGGAILGLSTLSFYGRPQEKLNNIPIGFAAGVIAGTTYVTYRAATNPTEFYSVRPQFESETASLSRSLAAERSVSQPLSFVWNYEF